MEITGKIKVINDTQEVGSNGFKKRELVVTTDEQYPQDILIEFVQDKCGILDKYKVGDNVKVSINIRGREWVDPKGVSKYFNSIQGWRIESLGESDGVQPPFEPVAAGDLNADDKDDLPF